MTRIAPDGRDLLARLTEAEARARHAEHMLASMMAISPEAIIVTDEQGVIQLFSLGAQALFGYGPDEVVGHDIEMLMPPEARGRHRAHVDDFAAGSGASLRMGDRGPIQGQRKTGEAFPAEASVARLQSPAGRRFAVILRDLTEYQRSEQRLRDALEAAEQSNRAKNVFLANMSHEIRTPLNGVLGVAQVLLRGRLEPEQERMVRLIETSGRALEQLLSDTLDLAKVDAGRLSITHEPFDLAQLADDVHALFLATAAEKGITLNLDLSDDVRGIFLGDSLRIRQVLSNLISNAVKFTPQGDILVSAWAEPRPDGRERILFAVRDSGIGFDAAVAQRLFERFEQADNTTTRRFGGTGLGLAISRSLVELMGGAIRAEGRPGQGATFTFELPLSRLEAAPARTAPPRAVPAARDRRPTVLLAEDHPTNRRVVELILGAVPIDLTIVANGEDAVAAATERAFDVILMDMQMPVMDGLTATRLIRALAPSPDVPPPRIITLTANAMPEHRQASEAAGADGFLTKPIDAAALIAAVLDEPDQRLAS